MVEEINVEMFGGSLCVRSWGDPSKPKVLGLHGWLDNAASFDLIGPHLKDFNLLALDFPGHGFSSHWNDALHYHFVDVVTATAELVEKLELKKFDILGHSLGGAIGCFLASILPDRVEHLAILDVLGPFAAEADGFAGRLRDYLQRRKALFRSMGKLYPDLENTVRAKIKANPMPEDAARLIIERNFKPVEGGYQWRSDPKWTLHSPIRMTEAHIQNVLSEIQCPTFLVEVNPAELEHFVNVTERKKVVPNLTVKQFPGSHHIHMEKPEEVATLVTDFYQKVPGTFS